MPSWLTNWKTTVLGVAAILTALSGALTSMTTGDLTTSWKDFGVIFAGLAAILAKDAGSSS